ncbi:nitroreductase family protein [Massilia scottii]|uniref:nitroreductase family protein n=1 Tax=Massilia scottii TaxID=3057166 RepID=UPI002796CC5F|nr:nitroreductase family protein [Massilia sp. CCM 9029]MDQ1831756.1 nitroreductase family protein [Massilia sp. CCM 9029]
MDKQDRCNLPITLIAPAALALDAGFPPLSMALFEVLLRRRSCRDIAGGELHLYQLSRLLWAAFGINRPTQGGHTAPSAQHMREISVYVAMASGLYRYDARAHVLCPVLAEDIRAATGDQEYAATAPVNLIYVAECDPAPAALRAEQQFHAALDTGYISQNVYLFCAAEGLATVACSRLDRAALAARMQLRPGQEVILAQSLGCPGTERDLNA